MSELWSDPDPVIEPIWKVILRRIGIGLLHIGITVVILDALAVILWALHKWYTTNEISFYGGMIVVALLGVSYAVGTFCEK